MSKIRVVSGVLAQPRSSIKTPIRYLIGSRNHEIHRGKWEFPGGKIDPGETPEQALQREWKEELNLDVTVGFLYGSLSYELIDISCYRLFLVGNLESMQLNNHYEIRWVTKDQLIAMEPRFGTPSLTRFAALIEGEQLTKV